MEGHFLGNSNRTFRTTFSGRPIIPVGTDQTECGLPFIFPCGLISRFTYSHLFYKVQTGTETTWFLRWAKNGRLHATVWCGSTLGSVLLNTGFCLCFCKATYVLQARAPDSQPLSSVCVTLFQLKQVTNLKVSNIKRRLAYFQSFIERCLPHRRSILRGVHVRKVSTSWVQF